MDFLNNVGYFDDEILNLSMSIPSLIKENIIKQNKLVLANLLHIKNLGIENYKDVFEKHYEIFLLDHSTFISVFEKYDKEDLIKYLKKDVDVLEFL